MNFLKVTGIIILISLITKLIIDSMKSKLPSFRITEIDSMFIGFEFDGIEHRIMQNMQDTFKSKSGLVLVVMSDTNGVLFKLYSGDKLVIQYPNTFFKK